MVYLGILVTRKYLSWQKILSEEICPTSSKLQKKKSFNFLPKYQDSSKGRRYNLKTGKFLFNVRNRGWGKKQNENVWNSNSAVTIESCISQKNIINRTADGHGILIRQGVICSGLQQFFVYLRFVTTRQNNFLLVGWGHFFFFVTTRQNNFLVVGWGQFFSMSPQDKIIFSWWVGGNFFHLKFVTSRSSPPIKACPPITKKFSSPHGNICPPLKFFLHASRAFSCYWFHEPTSTNRKQIS